MAYAFVGSNPTPCTNLTCHLSSGVEHIHGKDGVSGSNPEGGSTLTNLPWNISISVVSVNPKEIHLRNYPSCKRNNKDRGLIDLYFYFCSNTTALYIDLPDKYSPLMPLGRLRKIEPVTSEVEPPPSKLRAWLLPKAIMISASSASDNPTSRLVRPSHTSEIISVSLAPMAARG
jgi:hypothetical protein